MYVRDPLRVVVTGPLATYTAGFCAELERPGYALQPASELAQLMAHVSRRLDGQVKVRSVWGQQVPVTLRIDLTGTVGSGNIAVRPPRRAFPQWLRRMRQHLADE